MTIDLTGGIDPARELMFAERPDNPEMRDSASFWVFDDRGQVGLPRIGIEAVAANWDAHGIQVNVAFPDGRVYRLREDAARWPVEGPDGMATVLGAGPLAFTCVEPFNVWTITFDGQAVQTSSADLVDGAKDGPLVDLQFEVEAKLAVPPWVQGALQPDASSALKTSIEGDLMGGPRYEQLFRATGAVRVGRRRACVHRQRSADPPPGRAPARGILGALLAVGAVRRAAGRSATSPTRRAPTASPRSTRATSSTVTATSIPARVVEAPWLTRLQPLGEDVSVVLETADGSPHIEGEIVLVYPRHHRPERDSGRPVGQARELDVPGAAAGGRALSMGR